MISAISVKDRLKNRAIATGKTMQETLTAYGLERTVYRLSVSEYKERFTLKGGIFLYALFDGEFVRATRDIDLLAKNIPNNLQDMRNIFEKIFAIESDDALKFDPDTLDVKSITEFKEYHGVNVSIIAYLDRTKIPVSIDIGFGDIIYPDRIKMDFPVLLNMETPQFTLIPSILLFQKNLRQSFLLALSIADIKISMTFISLLLTMNWIQKNSKKQSLKPLNIEAQNLTILLLLRKNLRKMNSITGDGILL